VIAVRLPLRLQSVANLREHWAAKARRTKQRFVAGVLVGAAVGKSHGRWLGAGMVVALVRVAPRALDSDNLAASMKAVQDGVADALGIDDADGRVTWRYEQRRGAPKEYAVEVRLMAADVREVG
jgi:hypothetical protein